jgi:hypothetical protein
MHFSRAADAVIRVYDDAGNVIETHERRAILNSQASNSASLILPKALF